MPVHMKKKKVNKKSDTNSKITFKNFTDICPCISNKQQKITNLKNDWSLPKCQKENTPATNDDDKMTNEWDDNEIPHKSFIASTEANSS